MELKHHAKPNIDMLSYVLIVPSGIETNYFSMQDWGYIVLIVPSGIETFIRLERLPHIRVVLIVPSGIETIL